MYKGGVGISDLNRAYSKSNLLRAWRWINSNPSYQYKNYFRDSYSAYNISLDKNLTDLSKRLREGVYKPCKPTLLLLPKNGISTRPYTLLSVEDQIVYQSMVNIVAESFYSKLKKDYYTLTFGNLYAGKRSTFFYRKWENGFHTFNKAVKDTFKQGFMYIASFDLTACYDTIDHHVLGYVLENNGIEKEFVIFLNMLLKAWSSNVEIYKGHGIPQGPLSSGLLAEVLLSYFDEKYKRQKNKDNIKYLRYVDDIKLLSTNEKNLMRMLARLDYYSKQIGLFPQSAKIEIKKVTNIDDEILSLSNLGMEIKLKKILKNNSLLTDFKSTYNGARVINKTKFKMYLGAITPNASISNKLIEILSHNPQYFQNISNYFSRYPRRVSDKVLENIIYELERPEAFQVVTASMIDSIAYNTSDVAHNKLLALCLNRWKNKKQLNPQLRYTIAKFLLINQKFKFKEIKKYLEVEQDWWIKKSLLKYVDIDLYGESSYFEILKLYLESDSIELNIAGINAILENDLNINFDTSNINYRSQFMLKDAGYINRSAKRPSAIHDCLKNITNHNVKSFNWKKAFGKEHKAAENKMIRAKTYATTDMSAFVNIVDTFNDMLLQKVFLLDGTIGSYQLGNIGGVLYNSGTAFEQKYPCLFSYCKKIHELRLTCDLSHPIVKKTKKYTNPIPYKTIYSIRPLLKNALTEIENIL